LEKQKEEEKANYEERIRELQNQEEPVVNPGKSPSPRQPNPAPVPPLRRQDVVDLTISLPNIIATLERACLSVQGAEDADLLICIGNTGSGKSTLLASLIYGVDQMRVETKERTVGKSKRTTTYQVIECAVPDNVFKIGHSSSQSETFVPNIWHDAATGITYTDVAGLNDAGGGLIEIVNNFLIKHIL